MDLPIGDPWLYMTAFGFVSSAGLLVYLVRQLNAASEDDETTALADKMEAAEAAVPAPAPKPAMPAAAPKMEPKAAAADAVSQMLSPAPMARPDTRIVPPPAPVSSRSPSELSPAVAFIKALHEDIQTFHWEIQAIKKKLDNFEENQQKQMETILAKIQTLEGGGIVVSKPPPSETPPPSPFQ